MQKSHFASTSEAVDFAVLILTFSTLRAAVSLFVEMTMIGLVNGWSSLEGVAVPFADFVQKGATYI
jgi:hypothetical protein